MSNNRTEIFEEVEIESSHIGKKDINKIISNEKKINSKYSKLDMNRFDRFIKQIKLAISLVKDFRNKSYTQVPWRTIALISAAIIYFINPFDAVPDILPVIGIADDAILFATVLNPFSPILSVMENGKVLIHKVILIKQIRKKQIVFARQNKSIIHRRHYRRAWI
jgi:uncharacterized membrane protein YkvA (DUF1232 family)